MTNFLELPSDILLEILGNVEYRTLLQCSRVCQTLKQLIRDSIKLQYLIELAAAGMVNNTSSDLSYQERLSMLHHRNQRWATLDWHKHLVISFPMSAGEYELVGGVFARTIRVINSPSHHLFATYLPSNRGPSRLLMKEQIVVEPMDFTMDPSQDLLVVLNRKPSEFVRPIALLNSTTDRVPAHPRYNCSSYPYLQDPHTAPHGIRSLNGTLRLKRWALLLLFKLWITHLPFNDHTNRPYSSGTGRREG
jgi:hypothetical protein